jgi:hypothetical protein
MSWMGEALFGRGKKGTSPVLRPGETSRGTRQEGTKKVLASPDLRYFNTGLSIAGTPSAVPGYPIFATFPI